MKTANGVLVIVATLALWGQSAQAGSCQYGTNDLAKTGLSYYSTNYGKYWCTQAFIDSAWKGMGMEQKKWNNGFGYDDSCNLAKPLAIALTSLWVLSFSTPNPPQSISDRSGGFLRVAYGYSATAIDHLRPSCDSSALSSNEARSFLGIQTSGGIVELKLPWFYSTVHLLHRTAAILHEARHRYVDHNGGARCPDGGSCDTTWEFGGANMYEASYLWEFCDRGAVNTTLAMKNAAKLSAQYLIDRRFVTRPKITIGACR